jgi:hypothetical protein
MKSRASVFLEKICLSPSSTHRLWFVARVGALRVCKLSLPLL